MPNEWVQHAAAACTDTCTAACACASSAACSQARVLAQHSECPHIGLVQAVLWLLTHIGSAVHAWRAAFATFGRLTRVAGVVCPSAPQCCSSWPAATAYACNKGKHHKHSVSRIAVCFIECWKDITNKGRLCFSLAGRPRLSAQYMCCVPFTVNHARCEQSQELQKHAKAE